MSNSTERRGIGPGGQVLLMLALAITIVGGFATWFIGAQTVRELARILVVSMALALVIASLSLPIRAYRRQDATGETHYIHDGTRTIIKEKLTLDGRTMEKPMVFVPGGNNQMAYADALTGAYRAGTVAAGAGQGQLGARSTMEAMPGAEDGIGMEQMDLIPVGGWEGRIE